MLNNAAERHKLESHVVTIEEPNYVQINRRAMIDTQLEFESIQVTISVLTITQRKATTLTSARFVNSRRHL